MVPLVGTRGGPVDRMNARNSAELRKKYRHKYRQNFKCPRVRQKSPFAHFFQAGAEPDAETTALRRWNDFIADLAIGNPVTDNMPQLHAT